MSRAAAPGAAIGRATVAGLRLEYPLDAKVRQRIDAVHRTQPDTAAVATVAIGGSGGLLLYWLVGRLLKIDELREVTGMARGRLRLRASG